MKVKRVEIAMVERLDEFYTIPYRAWLEDGRAVNGVISIRDPLDRWMVLNSLLTDIQHQISRNTLRARLEADINDILTKGNIHVLNNPNV